jgi:hypothetical protein
METHFLADSETSTRHVSAPNWTEVWVSSTISLFRLHEKATLTNKNKNLENRSLNSRKQEIRLLCSIAAHLPRLFKDHRNRYETRNFRATELSSLKLHFKPKMIHYFVFVDV